MRAITAVLLFIAMTVPTGAQETDEPFDEWAESPTMCIEGCGEFRAVRVLVDGSETEARGFICNGMAYLAAREALERLGAKVVWVKNERSFYAQFQERERTVRATIDSLVLQIYQLDSTQPTGAGRELSSVKISVAPFACEGRAFVPVRAISEASGASVRYDKGSHTVYIDSPKPGNK